MDATSVASLAPRVDFRDSTTSPSSGRHRPARSTVLRSPRGLLGGGDILGGISTIISDVTSPVDGDVATVLGVLGGKHRPTSSSTPLGPSPQPPLSSPADSPGTTASGSPAQPPTYSPTAQPPPAPSNSASQPSQNPNPNPSPQSTPSSPRPTATAETSAASETASRSESGRSPTPTSSVVSNYADTALSLISTPNDLWLGSTGVSTPTFLPFTKPPDPTQTPFGYAKESSMTGTLSPESPESPESPTGPAPYTPPNGAHPQRFSTGAIVGIALGALAFVLCTVLCLFLLLRRRRRAWGRSRRMSVESARWRLKPYSYDDDDSSRRVSSVWTGFGSVSVDPHFERERESIADSLDFRFAEKPGAELNPARPASGAAAYTQRGPSPSPCPSPAPAETQPLARGVSLSSVRHSLHPPSVCLPAGASSSSSADLLALAGTDYAVANPFLDGSDRGLGRSVSGVSRATTASGDVQSVEAL